MGDIVEKLRSDAASSQEGYQCICYVRTVSEAADTIGTLRRLLVKYGDRVRMATSNDDQQIIDDAFAAHQGAGEP